MVSLQLVDEIKISSIDGICAADKFFYLISGSRKRDFSVDATEGPNLWPDNTYYEFLKKRTERETVPSEYNGLGELNELIESTKPLDYLFDHFTDGTNLYALSRKGRIVGCAQDSLVLLDEFGHELNENKAIDCVYNGKYTVVVHVNHARIFSSGKMVGKSSIKTRGIKDIAMDDNFAYLLRRDCIQKYSIIDSECVLQD